MPEGVRVPAEMRIGPVLGCAGHGAGSDGWGHGYRLSAVYSSCQSVFERSGLAAESGSGNCGSRGIRHESAVWVRAADDGVYFSGWAFADAGVEAPAVSDLLRRRASDRGTVVRIECGDAGRSRADCAGHGFDTVDLNLGCPAKRVVGCNGGSGLLRDLPKIGEIFRTVAPGGDDSLHREVPHGLERCADCVCGTGANG